MPDARTAIESRRDAELDIAPGSDDVKYLTGFLRKGPRDGSVYLFSSPAFDNALEIREEDIVRRQALPPGDDALERTAVWIRRSAKVLRTHRISISREAEFLHGTLVTTFLARCPDGTSTAGPTVPLDVFASKSETTLTCWPDCTHYLSGC